MLRHPQFARDHRPEVVLRLGEQPASKVLAQWLASCRRAGGRGGAARRLDRSRSLRGAHRLGRSLPSGRGAHEATPGDGRVRHAMARALGARGGGRSASHRRHARRRSTRRSEPGVAREVMASLPDDSALVLSSSMPVRDVEWFAAPRSGVEVYSNRGANGIDGVVSTAVGVALARRVPTTVLIGDVALLHDTNGMLGAASRGIDLTIVVVDNDGGGIFSFLPQATELPPDTFERLFGTPHGVDLGALAAVYGIPEVSAVGDGTGVRMVRVRTDRTDNVHAHDRDQPCSGRRVGLRPQERPDHRGELRLRLGELGVDVGLADHARLPHRAGPRSVDLRAPQRDCPSPVARGVDPADRSRVAAAIDLLQLVDQCRARWRAGSRRPPESGAALVRGRAPTAAASTADPRPACRGAARWRPPRSTARPPRRGTSTTAAGCRGPCRS